MSIPAAHWQASFADSTVQEPLPGNDTPADRMDAAHFLDALHRGTGTEIAQGGDVFGQVSHAISAGGKQTHDLFRQIHEVAESADPAAMMNLTASLSSVDLTTTLMVNATSKASQSIDKITNLQ